MTSTNKLKYKIKKGYENRSGTKVNKRERLYIVVDENNKPMSFRKISRQLVYNSVSRYGRFYLAIYSKAEAEKHIKTTIKNRKKWGMYQDGDRYYLMRVNACKVGFSKSEEYTKSEKFLKLKEEYLKADDEFVKDNHTGAKWSE